MSGGGKAATAKRALARTQSFAPAETRAICGLTRSRTEAMPVQWLARIVRQRGHLVALVGRPRTPSERAMYLVEIEAGREQVYPSVEALAAAIRRGVIGPDSRIFHRASSSWISITLHPEYRKAMAARAAEPLPPLARSQWTFFGDRGPRSRDRRHPRVQPASRRPPNHLPRAAVSAACSAAGAAPRRTREQAGS